MLPSAIAAVTAACLLTGCASSGLSYREGGARTQGAYLNALYTDVNAASVEPASPFRAPASIAVAQIGEVSPPLVMISRLREQKSLFARVEAIPATGGAQQSWDRSSGDSAARSEIDSLRSMAASLGMDYLLLVGGSVDQTQNGTPLSALNLTIIGAFIIPSHQTHALMKASGALIDVRSGRIVCISNAELHDDHLTPLISSEGDSARLLERMRDRVTVALADAVAVDCVNPAARSAVTVDASKETTVSTPAGRNAYGSLYQGR